MHATHCHSRSDEVFVRTAHITSRQLALAGLPSVYQLGLLLSIMRCCTGQEAVAVGPGAVAAAIGRRKMQQFFFPNEAIAIADAAAIGENPFIFPGAVLPNSIHHLHFPCSSEAPPICCIRASSTWQARANFDSET